MTTTAARVERSEETAEKLLAATIETLIELGYSCTTTVEVVRRSGLSRGGMLHHFSSKAELVSAAMARIAEQNEAYVREHLTDPGSQDLLFVDFVDRVWEVMRGPLFYAALELWVAARTDEELRSAWLPAERSVGVSLRSLASKTIEMQDEPDGHAIFELTMALMRGLALTNILRRDSRAPALLEKWKQMVNTHLEVSAERSF